MKAKKRNATLWILLALLVVVAVLIWLLPDGIQRREARAAAETEVPDPTLKRDATARTGEQDEAALIDAATVVGVGDVAPDFTVPLFDGGSRQLSGLRGKVVLLTFWATWCPPCREELTRVQAELIDRFRGRDFVFLPISRGETREDVARFRERMNYRFPMGLDSLQTIYKRYATNYIPRNFLIGRDGRVVLATTGYEPEEFDRLVESIEQTLNQ